jgi:hypothetical protein
MTEQTKQDSAISLEELVIAHSYEMLALITVLENKGLLNRSEVIDEIEKLKQR